MPVTMQQRDALAARNAIYIDTEARQTSQEAGGFCPQMGVSMLGLFDYSKWRSLGGLRFATHPGDTIDVLSRRPSLWVGHNLVRYDLGVMLWDGYLDDVLSTSEREPLMQAARDGKTNTEIGQRIQPLLAKRDIEIVDTLEIGLDTFGFRPGLDGFLGPMGMKKLDSGIEAPGMARRGEWGRLTTYLAGDVRGGMMVFEEFLSQSKIPFEGRRGKTMGSFGASWLRRRQEILSMPAAVQQDLFDAR